MKNESHVVVAETLTRAEWAEMTTMNSWLDLDVVEIDQAKFAKRKYNKEHSIEGQWAFEGINHTAWQTFLIQVEKSDKKHF